MRFSWPTDLKEWSTFCHNDAKLSLSGSILSNVKEGAFKMTYKEKRPGNNSSVIFIRQNSASVYVADFIFMT